MPSAGENHDLKNGLAELTRRYHELELESRRLENERAELATAYKEAEAVSRVTGSPAGAQSGPQEREGGILAAGHRL